MSLLFCLFGRLRHRFSLLNHFNSLKQGYIVLQKDWVEPFVIKEVAYNIRVQLVLNKLGRDIDQGNALANAFGYCIVCKLV